MADINTLQTKIQGLIDLSNTTTGKQDITLNSAVNSLVEGYGKNTESTLGKYLSKTLTELNPEDFGTAHEIPVGFFKETALDTVNLKNTDITVLRDDCFRYCSSLNSVELGNTKYRIAIGSYAFYQCINLKTISNSFQCTSIGEKAFAYTDLSNMNSLSLWRCNGIAGSAFLESKIRGVITIQSEEDIQIGSRAFKDCINLTGFIIDNPQLYVDTEDYPDTDPQISFGSNVFEGTNFETLYIEGNVSAVYKLTNISDETIPSIFAGSKIKRIDCWDGSIPVEV